ncbi:MAG TPA: hypothetical protein VMT24_09480 [Aggregatilineaceae bacterium]|nr:hypothetical protein [Aggregatilineaceae bacterium]
MNDDLALNIPTNNAEGHFSGVIRRRIGGADYSMPLRVLKSVLDNRSRAVLYCRYSKKGEGANVSNCIFIRIRENDVPAGTVRSRIAPDRH